MFHLPIVKKFPTIFFNSTAECMKRLKVHRCVSTASDYGSITAWCYDATLDGQKPVYRANRSAWMVVQDEIETTNLSELRSFVAKNMKLI